MQFLTALHNRVPVLQTERLTLRGHEIADFPDCLALWSDPLVTRHIGGRPLTGEEVWTRILRYVGHWTLLGFGYWLVAERDSNCFIGEVGFADFKRQLDPPCEGLPEIGWALAPWAQGQGYALEAVRAALDWGDGQFGELETCCLIDPDNIASIRLAERSGYREAARAVYKDNPTILFKRPPGGS